MSKNTAVVAVKADAKPTLSRHQLMVATAQAMADEHNALVAAAEASRAKLIAARDKKLEAIARKSLPSTRARVSPDWGDSHNVDFSVRVPKSAVAEEDAKIKAAPVLQRKRPEQFLKELKEAAAAQDTRVQDLLSNPKAREQLIVAGRQILEGKAKLDAIQV